MDIQVNDHIFTKKNHPCGANEFLVLRVGMDFKIQCVGCGREVMLPRAKIEKKYQKGKARGRVFITGSFFDRKGERKHDRTITGRSRPLR